jgi:hypothetical protein
VAIISNSSVTIIIIIIIIIINNGSIVFYWTLAAFSAFCAQSVELLGWGISPSQDRYLHRTTLILYKIHRHPSLLWDSNPHPQCTVCRASWMGDQPVTRPLPTQDNINTV